jgi:formyl-CoA transferase
MGLIRERSGSILNGIAPSNVYKCKDGEYMIGANKDSLWKRLAAAMGRPELGDDPRYATHLARGENQIELDALINDWTRTLTIAEVDALMIAHSIPAGNVYRAPEMLADPHFQAREAIVEVETERFGQLKMQGAFPKLSATPSGVRRPAPARGSSSGIVGSEGGCDGAHQCRSCVPGCRPVGARAGAGRAIFHSGEFVPAGAPAADPETRRYVRHFRPEWRCARWAGES